MTRPKADGAAGARRAAAILGIASCAETTAGSFSQDAAKVDVLLSFRNAFDPGKLVTLHAQVKSGRSYRALSSNRDTLTLNIDRETIGALTGLQVPGLLIWVPPQSMDRLYWHANHPRRPPRTPIRINRDEYLRPSIRYDLSRLAIHSAFSTSNAMQVVASRPVPVLTQRAKAAFKRLQARTLTNPLVGKVSVTRLAWRHATRRAKTKKQRLTKLLIAPYLKSFIEKPPDRFIRDQGPIISGRKRTIDTRYILCWYRSALSISGEPYSLLLRIRERISYPRAWLTHPLGVEDIWQEAALISWWCKKI
jgi:hypothetical protein